MPRPKRNGRAINVWIDARLRGWVDYIIADVTRRKLTEEVSIALESHIKSLGYDPGKPPPKPTRAPP